MHVARPPRPPDRLRAGSTHQMIHLAFQQTVRVDGLPSFRLTTCAMQGWQLQKECLGHVQQFAAAGQLGHDYLIVLQHNPVYTLGTSPLGHESCRCPGAMECNKPGCSGLQKAK
jgi:hypothetical protein